MAIDGIFYEYRNLKKSNLIIGRHPVLEALKTATPIERIYIMKEAKGEGLSEIRRLAIAAGVPYQNVPSFKLDRLSRGNHQGIIASGALISYQKTSDLVSFVIDRGESPLLLLTEGITDVRNIGAISRTALGAGAHGMIIPYKESAEINDFAIKASAGALTKLPVCRENNLLSTLRFLKLHGIQSVATSLDANTTPDKIDYTLPTVVLMGSEDKGLSEELLNEVDFRVKIPISPQIDSYNVSVASGMLLYEAVMQRSKSV